ncbi:uncharacterized protein LACBIDRAFT_313970 [Laccaria bicolor S238N-H82]|uniref:Predicted protein n=1 Tax=Laccaria bicolor (strain S238N-H82 / ATCC MYA-4686) TaxID=486041 RepID=B0D198_LACBS|nr:uncharacterized protein LACBIDRAFT_313970 [Laccaria bicolor S238N-H82]EDR11964.1 predicted protein [Laccaria bicolor S238N-H82]|eukprot:XP_001877861.1 predicted protein [Laccaria bicolor S238N-H82]
MPSFQAIIEDTSPFLIYSTNWSSGTSADSSADKYSQSSFTLTQSANTTMSFTFFGTSVGIYGAKRGNHGPYQVQVDNQQFPAGNGVASPDAFNQTLFSTSLQKGVHTVTLTNGANTYLDVDYISWQTSVGNDDEALIVNTYKDSHPSFSYSPASSWGTPDFVSSFSGSTGQEMTVPQQVRALSLNLPSLGFSVEGPHEPCAGDAVGLYGPVGPNGVSVFSAQVDGGTPTNSTTNKQFYRPQQLLYYAGNLGRGGHTLKIQFGSSSGSGQALAIDYAEVYTTPSLGGSFGTTQAISASSTFPTGAIAGLSITSTLAFLALAGLVFLFIRKRRNHPSTISEKPNPVHPRVEPFTFPPTPQDAPIASQPSYNPSSLSFSSSSNPAIATGYQSTFPASGMYDDYVSSNAVRIPLPRTFKFPCLCQSNSRTTTGQSAKIV